MPKTMPIKLSNDSCLVLFDGVSTINCLKYLEWPLPDNVIDLYAEFKSANNDNNPDAKYDIDTALNVYGVKTKTFGIVEMADIPLDWLEETNLDKIILLVRAMLTTIDVKNALTRGAYMKALAEVEWNGVPLDTEILSKLRDNWDNIKEKVISEIDANYGVFNGHSLDENKFEEWLFREQYLGRENQTSNLNSIRKLFKIWPKYIPRLTILKNCR